MPRAGWCGGSREPRPLSAPWARGLILLLSCAVLALVASSDALHSALLQVLASAARITAGRPLLGAGLFVLLSAASAMLAFLSSALLVPIVLDDLGKALCMFLLWFGWLLGGVAAYGIGRFLGRPVVRSLLPAALLSRYEDRISERTPWGVVLLFQLALPSEVPGYLLGLARYRFARYVASLALAELPYAVGTVYLGASFLDRNRLVLMALGFAGALLMVLTLHALHGCLRPDRRSRRGSGNEERSFALVGQAVDHQVAEEPDGEEQRHVEATELRACPHAIPAATGSARG